MQPLSSNVLSKQMGGSTNTGEAQYMQQQSQIFVFSTLMANKAAELVLANQFPTIIAFHMAQPTTKKFLEVSQCLLFTSHFVNSIIYYNN